MVDSREIQIEVHRMKNTLVAVALAFVVSALPAYTQNQAPKPPESPSKILLDDWNEIGRKLTAMAEDFPEDKYDFKPNPAERSFAEQLLHAANANSPGLHATTLYGTGTLSLSSRPEES
jgi:hypothetical protein